MGRNNRVAEPFDKKFRRLTVFAENGCLEWTGPLNHSGYALFREEKFNTRVHRWTYEQYIGPIPDGLVLDHLCQNPKCVNPTHLEPVTIVENLRRGKKPRTKREDTHCKIGHEFDEVNTGWQGNKRYCKTCHSQRQKDRAAKDGWPYQRKIRSEAS